MVCWYHRALAGPIAASARPAGGDVTRSDSRSTAHDLVARRSPPSRAATPPGGDDAARPRQWARALAAAVAAAILGFYLPILLARGSAERPPTTVCDRAAVETSTGPGC